MPPNRKNVSTVGLPIAVDTLTFLPLTDPREQKQHERLQVQNTSSKQQGDAVNDSMSYWDWPSDTQEEEKVESLFSTARIESNLILDGKKYESCTGSQLAVHDDYWAENASSNADCVRSVLPQHQSDQYWSWYANRNLHKEQLAERLTASTRMEELLSRENSKLSSTSSPVQQHDNYWEWPADSQPQQQHPRLSQSQSDLYWTWDTLSTAEKKQQLIDSILQYERARNLLSADHIQKQMIASASAVDNNDIILSTATSIPSSGYWDW
ncbi:hypothetical protein IV203_021666 [Nitzschia inconspicua]|uniref:Uncharacterized protein n=1 Tax=Nitzschia inconspicua TaxID=303405 RepID=A0A9K3KH65_9STRA|nr:hypothetical protein IV203_022780 [Nitzschia inconspicua]KAG7343658.1 hypothetical protein IV203_021666 [Nitzschia inconspicua]